MHKTFIHDILNFKLAGAAAPAFVLLQYFLTYLDNAYNDYYRFEQNHSDMEKNLKNPRQVIAAQPICSTVYSEGAQFVHRLVWFLPEARFSKAVAANAGWYTMPDFDTEFPYGLGKTPATPGSAKRSLERNVVVLLGDKDTDPNHSQLNKSAQAMQQGPYRLARGENFHHQAQARCEVLKCRFGWTLQRVPGAAYSNAQVAPRAAELLMQKDAGALPDRRD